MAIDTEQKTLAARVVKADGAPAAIGPYSAGIQVPLGSAYVFTSGQLPLDAASGEQVAGDAGVQVTTALRNALSIVEAAGSSLRDIVKVSVFLTDMDEFGLVNEAYAEFFGAWHPARSVVEVSRLPRNCSVEVEMIALARDEPRPSVEARPTLSDRR